MYFMKQVSFFSDFCIYDNNMYIITFYEGKKKEIIVLKISTRYIERNIDLDEFEI